MKQLTVTVFILLAVQLASVECSKDESENKVAREEREEEDFKWYGYGWHPHPFAGASSLAVETTCWVACLIVAYAGIFLLRANVNALQ